MFFWAISLLDERLSQRKVTPLEQTEKRTLKALYLLRYGTEALFKVNTAMPVAIGSDDHKWPRGTINDNSRNRNFNLKLYNYFQFKNDLKLLDLGCSGGGLVSSIIEDGYEAIGLEGSDASKKLRGGEWDVLVHHLFTCDVSTPFIITDLKSSSQIKFDAITMWEVLEHIPEDRIPVLFKNIRDHLAPGGIFVGSIDMTPDGNLLTGANYHVTLKPKGWWLKMFKDAGLVPVANNPFSTRDYVRGHGMGLRDWDPANGDGFHVVMCLA